MSSSQSSADPLPPTGKALDLGIAFTPQLNAEDIGRQRQIDLTAAAIVKAKAAADFVESTSSQVKGPAFALADIAARQRAGFAPASDNPGKLMGLGRAASAFGVGKALGEIAAELASETALLKAYGPFSSVASCSAGGRSPRERDRRRWHERQVVRIARRRACPLVARTP